MKVAFPLSLRVSLWLLLNLALLAGLGLAALVWQGGVGWDALVRGAAGERLQSAANLLAADLADAAPAQIAAALARLPASDAVEFALVTNRDGALRGGAALELPAEITRQLHAGRGGPRDAEAPPPPEAGPPPPDFAPPDDGAPSPLTPADLERGRHLLHVGDPSAWWLIVRLPPILRDGRPEPVSLVARAPSLFAVLRVLDLKPWLLAGGAAVLISILFWLPFVRSITRHLRQLGAATEKIAAGDFATRVPATRRDELGRLGEAVNTMAARLDILVNGQKKFLGDVAHELGSPLARLQLAVEILETRADPALHESLADVRDEVHQLTALVNELMAFTRAGLRPRASALASVELPALLREVLAREGASSDARLEVPPDLAVLADRELLARAIGNLVRNALRYAGPAAGLHVAALHEADRVLIAVEDDGPGVPPEALPRLGEPFYRPETARTRETGGVGLGLSIVCSCIAACGGEVAFANRSPRGFRAELRLRPADR